MWDLPSPVITLNLGFPFLTYWIHLDPCPHPQACCSKVMLLWGE